MYNGVCSDGIGDFSHFEDILKALLNNPQFSNVQFIAIVYFNAKGKKSNYDLIQHKLDELGIKTYFGTDPEHLAFITDTELQHHLSEADQVIMISSPSGFVIYEPYFKKNIPIKFIGEHETPDPFRGLDRKYLPRTITLRSMGLSREHYGLKTKDILAPTSEDAWEIIQHHSPEFATRLLDCTNSPDFQKFCTQNMILPAYFNKCRDFVNFLRLLCRNHSSLSNEKNIVIYYSGNNLSNFFSTNDGCYYRNGANATKTTCFCNNTLITTCTALITNTQLTALLKQQ